MARVAVDPDLCIGSGDCERLVPEAFRVDDALGISVVQEGAETVDLERLRDAARSCPTQAITVLVADATG